MGDGAYRRGTNQALVKCVSEQTIKLLLYFHLSSKRTTELASTWMLYVLSILVVSLLDKKNVKIYFMHNLFPFITLLILSSWYMIWEMYVLRLDIHCVKYAKTQASFDPNFPV